MEKKPVPAPPDIKSTPEISSSPAAPGRVTAAMLIEKIESLHRNASSNASTTSASSPASSVPAPAPAAKAPVKALPPPELVRADAEMQANLAFLLACIRRQKDQQIERTEVVDIVLD
jgi:hypothetical protein